MQTESKQEVLLLLKQEVLLLKQSEQKLIAEIKILKAANAALTTQRNELNNTVEELTTPPYKLTDVNENSKEYKQYYRTNQNNVRKHKTTSVKRAATLETFRGKRESILTQHYKDRHEIFELSQKIYVLERQVNADTAADNERARLDEIADQVAQARENLEEKVAEQVNIVRQGRKRARSLQLGEDLEEETQRSAPPPPPNCRYGELTTTELLNIARSRGYTLPDGTPRVAIVAVLDAPATAPASASAPSAPASAPASAPTPESGATVANLSDQDLTRMFRADQQRGPYDALSNEELAALAAGMDYPAFTPGSTLPSRAPSRAPSPPVPQPPPLETVPGRQRLSRQVSPTASLADSLREFSTDDETMRTT